MPPREGQRFPVVHVITTGGTISARIQEGAGYSPRLGGADLIAGLSGFVSAEITAEEFSRSLSFGATYELVGRLVAYLDNHLAKPGVSGAVVTHGTAAMEEVAYLCDLTLQSEKPVVFTGATYHASDPGSDGPHNILDAIRVAAAPEARDRGVMVSFAGEIHAARDVVKLHKYSPAAFTSPAGPLGVVDAGGVTFYRTPTGRVTFPFPRLPFPRVELIKAVMDMDDLLLRAALDTPAAGIVLEGFPGSGGVPPALLPQIGAALARGTPIVLTSRSPYGRITPVAAGESGPKVLEKMGVIMGGDLPPAKARLLLAVALGNGQSFEELRSLFGRIARGG